ncbi:uncharacterized protein K460DRAFT_404021 [Cucurbitaria berberidis CBS 394.84]|uniref:F-box domain-containing protein n=1 Tax=Cucurbitaria berberidis CBS 394.84 TaxID=1168544 RepID=A0A9P4LBN4_9PLEO|nr:uncharacterized protein K460DRAFT_404021 [Cucurbitaria berberidis CBS 394.84]KAF1848753.1 hypothetical protein K460DRAFT_404021 [Cucurbitaria berberidis CBS 394.84]
MTTTSYPGCHCEGFQHFLDLPRELRDKVYFFAMADMPTRLAINKRSTISKVVLLPHALPNLCFANKQLHCESVPVFLQRTRFIFEQPHVHEMYAFQLFASQFPRGLQSVRMLSIYDIIWYGESYLPGEFYPEALVSQCTGIRSLILEARVRSLSRLTGRSSGQQRHTARLYSKDELKTAWEFGNLFEMKKLTYLKFRCEIREYDLRFLGLKRAEDVLVNMEAVLKEGFEEKGRSVEVVVEVEVDGDNRV